MSAKLNHKEMMNAFRDATSGRRVDMTENEVASLVDSIEAQTHDEAVNEILVELGWKAAEPSEQSMDDYDADPARLAD